MVRLIILLLLSKSINLSAQHVLQNPSFENEPKASSIPKGWNTCLKGSTPDVLPGPWSVKKKAQHGYTFVGLITRDNGSYESIGQKLTTSLKANECYSFSIYLARSNEYIGYNLPLRLRIWGSKSFCGKDQLLAESKAIKHTNWVRYDFQIFTKLPVHYLLFEACLAPGISKPYKGNILLDNISVILPCYRAELISFD